MKRYARPQKIEDFIGKNVWVRITTGNYIKPLRLTTDSWNRPVLVYNCVPCHGTNPEQWSDVLNCGLDSEFKGYINSTAPTCIRLAKPVDVITNEEMLELLS